MEKSDIDFLENQNIVFSNNSISISGQIFYTKQINSLRINADIVNHSSAQIWLFLSVLLLIICFFVNIALGVLLFIPLGGAIAAAVGKLNKSSMYHLILTTSSGEINSFSSTEEQTVSLLAKLIDEHIKNGS